MTSDKYVEPFRVKETLGGCAAGVKEKDADAIMVAYARGLRRLPKPSELRALSAHLSAVAEIIGQASSIAQEPRP